MILLILMAIMVIYTDSSIACDATCQATMRGHDQNTKSCEANGGYMSYGTCRGGSSTTSVEGEMWGLIGKLMIDAVRESYANRQSEPQQASPSTQPQSERALPFEQRDYVYARVIRQDLMLRVKPGLDSEPLVKMPLGSSNLRVLKCKKIDDSDFEVRLWCKLEFDNYVGWASAKYLAADEYVPPSALR